MTFCTLLSPPDTASMLPETDQLTCKTTSSKVWRTLGTQLPPSFSVQMMTLLSWELEAIVCLAGPRLGAQTRRIGDKVAADGVGVVDLLRLPLVVSRVGEHGDGAIAGPTDQNKAKVMRCSLDRTDTAVMVGILVYLGPLAPLRPAIL